VFSIPLLLLNQVWCWYYF